MENNAFKNSLELSYNSNYYTPFFIDTSIRKDLKARLSYSNVLNSKYFTMAGIKTFMLYHNFSGSFESFLKSFVTSYNSGSTIFNGEMRSLRHSIQRCPNSSKRIIDKLKLGSLSCYTPNSFDNREYVIFSDTILESPVMFSGEILSSQAINLNFSKPVMVLVVDFDELINKFHKFHKKYCGRTDEHKIAYKDFFKNLQYKLLVDKDFSKRKDSKSLLSRVLKHYYHQTEEAKKSVDVVYTTSEEIIENTFSEMYYQSLIPPRKTEIIKELVS